MRPDRLALRTNEFGIVKQAVRMIAARAGQPCKVALPYGLFRGVHHATFVRRYQSGRVEVAFRIYPGSRLIYAVTDPGNVLSLGWSD